MAILHINNHACIISSYYV